MAFFHKKASQPVSQAACLSISNKDLRFIFLYNKKIKAGSQKPKPAQKGEQ